MIIDNRIDARTADVASRFTLEAFTRRAIAEKVNSQWALSLRAEQSDRADRVETMMATSDYNFARRYLLTPVQRDKVRDAVAAVPNNIRSDLELQSTRLATGVYKHLAAEQRRRFAEIRCMLTDALMYLDALEFSECRRLLADAVHAIEYMLSNQPDTDRPSRLRVHRDTHLRELLNVIARHLRADVTALREVAT
jgi:hypothetical protein